MTDKEKRELDVWIDEHLFDSKKYVGLVKRGLWYRPGAHGYTGNESEAGRWLIGDAIKLTDPNGDEPVTVQSFSPRHYTTDPAAAMEVLKKIAERLGHTPDITRESENCWVFSNWQTRENTRCDTFELAICKFAQQLYGKDK